MERMDMENKAKVKSLERVTSRLGEISKPPMHKAQTTASCSQSHAVSRSFFISATATSPAPAVIKSDHIKMTFPTYRGPNDDPDPVNYLSICQDFLALRPLSDADILATFRTLLQGTPRDWWKLQG